MNHTFFGPKIYQGNMLEICYDCFNLALTNFRHFYNDHKDHKAKKNDVQSLFQLSAEIPIIYAGNFCLKLFVMQFTFIWKEALSIESLYLEFVRIDFDDD